MAMFVQAPETMLTAVGHIATKANVWIHSCSAVGSLLMPMVCVTTENQANICEECCNLKPYRCSSGMLPLEVILMFTSMLPHPAMARSMILMCQRAMSLSMASTFPQNHAEFYGTCWCPRFMLSPEIVC